MEVATAGSDLFECDGNKCIRTKEIFDRNINNNQSTGINDIEKVLAPLHLKTPQTQCQVE